MELTETCDHPGPDQVLHRIVEDLDGEPRPGWQDVEIGIDRAQEDILEIVAPYLAISKAQTGERAIAVWAGDLPGPNSTCGFRGKVMRVRPARGDDPEHGIYSG